MDRQEMTPKEKHRALTDAVLGLIDIIEGRGSEPRNRYAELTEKEKDAIIDAPGPFDSVEHILQEDKRMLAAKVEESLPWFLEELSKIHVENHGPGSPKGAGEELFMALARYMMTHRLCICPRCEALKGAMAAKAYQRGLIKGG